MSKVCIGAETAKVISRALEQCCDEGPMGEGWKSESLDKASAELEAAIDSAGSLPEPGSACEYSFDMFQSEVSLIQPVTYIGQDGQNAVIRLHNKDAGRRYTSTSPSCLRPK